MSDHPLDSDPAWLTMRRLVDAGEHKIAVLESMVKGRDAIIESLRSRLALLEAERAAQHEVLMEVQQDSVTATKRLAAADALLQITWELETNQYKYPVDDYGDRLQAYHDAHLARKEC